MPLLVGLLRAEPLILSPGLLPGFDDFGVVEGEMIIDEVGNVTFDYITRSTNRTVMES